MAPSHRTCFDPSRRGRSSPAGFFFISRQSATPQREESLAAARTTLFINSAVFLFSTLVPTFRAAFALDNGPGDVPTMLTTEPTLKFMAPVAFFNGDAVVDLKIDDQGRIINYSILGAPGPASDQLRHSIENSLLFTEFWPATNFGRPIAGTIRISFRSSHIDVRG